MSRAASVAPGPPSDRVVTIVNEIGRRALAHEARLTGDLLEARRRASFRGAPGRLEALQVADALDRVLGRGASRAYRAVWSDFASGWRVAVRVCRVAERDRRYADIPEADFAAASRAVLVGAVGEHQLRGRYIADAWARWNGRQPLSVLEAEMRSRFDTERPAGSVLGRRRTIRREARRRLESTLVDTGRLRH